MVGLIVVVGICILGAVLLFGGSGDSGDSSFVRPIVTSIPAAPTTAPLIPASPTATRAPFIPPSSTTEGQTWLVMLYQDADDKVLEKDIYVDLNEAERIGSTDRVQIVAQVDRFTAGYQGDGNWSSTRRFYVTHDDDLERVGSQLIDDIGEANMSSGETLVDFVTWAVETFPADKHVLILSDHGLGWPGGWSDPAPGGRGDPSIPLSSALGDELYLMEIDQALETIRDQSGLAQFEVLGMDACLMGHLEVFTALAPHARYAVASQETEPALGWAYTGFLGPLVRNPDMGGEELSRLIVQTYIQEDQRIVDDQARAELLRQGSPMGGLFGLLGGPSAAQVSQQMAQNTTLSAIDLAAMPDLIASVNDLAYALQQDNQPSVAQSRAYAQSFTSVFGRNVPASYIDLGSFAQLVKRQTSKDDVSRAVDSVLASLERAVIAERHGPGKKGATGISIYFPNSQLYQSPMTGPQSYTAVAERFASVSLWDEYLAFHYTGQGFAPSSTELVVPDRETPIRAPGVGRIDVSPLELAYNIVSPDQPTLMSTDIRGQNIGHIYLFAGYYDRAANSINIADRDYLESSDTREIDGVYYPVWPEDEEFTLEFEWEPIVFAINDGLESVPALFTPQSYGATWEEAVYTVDGIYTFGDGEGTRYARLYFMGGTLRQVFGFTGEGGMGAPREIYPQSGDTFTVLEKWLDLDQNGRFTEAVTQEGGTLTFRDEMFTWEDVWAAPGDYVIGFVVEDLDGNSFETSAQVTVE
jgi:hypothetical protein